MCSDDMSSSTRLDSNPRLNFGIRKLKVYMLLFSSRTQRGGLVVERRTPEREVGGSILTQVAVLCP